MKGLRRLKRAENAYWVYGIIVKEDAGMYASQFALKLAGEGAFGDILSGH